MSSIERSQTSSAIESSSMTSETLVTSVCVAFSQMETKSLTRLSLSIRISTLDAHVYAALAPVLQLDLPTSFLRQILSTYPNLLAHTARVQIKLFDVYHPRVVEAPTLSLRSLAPSLDWTGLRSRTGSRLRTEKEKDLSVRRAWYIMGVVSHCFSPHSVAVSFPVLMPWRAD